MRSHGLLDSNTLPRTEENLKTATIAADFVRVFASDFISAQPPSEWQLGAAKGAASAVKSTRRIKSETPASKMES